MFLFHLYPEDLDYVTLITSSFSGVHTVRFNTSLTAWHFISSWERSPYRFSLPPILQSYLGLIVLHGEV